MTRHHRCKLKCFTSPSTVLCISQRLNTANNCEAAKGEKNVQFRLQLLWRQPDCCLTQQRRTNANATMCQQRSGDLEFRSLEADSHLSLCFTYGVIQPRGADALNGCVTAQARQLLLQSPPPGSSRMCSSQRRKRSRWKKGFSSDTSQTNYGSNLGWVKFWLVLDGVLRQPHLVRGENNSWNM